MVFLLLIIMVNVLRDAYKCRLKNEGELVKLVPRGEFKYRGRIFFVRKNPIPPGGGLRINGVRPKRR